ncbi:hypothetical protein PR048_019926 [Dryococelus australis]|uniref:PiggyBac transposable element-derived protein domain-containing protein n=1 Tax=Dryococelus australis TaxID=614101 RepID=A0ABQ9H4T8_9NEOP|nr:hypothetical protein PR048_019926 [Dryococelus australis]
MGIVIAPSIVYSRRNRVRRRHNCTIQRTFGNEAILPHKNPQVRDENIQSDTCNSVPTSVVLQLCGPLLNSDRVIVTDNYYTSIDLANKLIDKSTNLLGTLRSNRKYNPETLVNKKLKRGEIVAQQNERGITILKCADKRDILVLSTCHGDDTVPVQRRNGIVNTPKTIMDYNKCKAAIDLSDQLSSYSTPLRRSLKWHRKVAIELLLGTTVVNARMRFCQITGKKIANQFP